MEQSEFSTQRLDHLGMVAGLCHEIGLITQIDAALGPSERKVSVGEAVQAMVLNALGFVGRALYLEEPIPLRVTRGHFKEQRPDLKPVVLSLITTYRSAIPVWREALSGNNSNKKSFVATLQAYTAQLKASESPYYVVDSALYGKDNLRELAEIRWITRVPETLKGAKQLLGSVAPEEMEPLGEGYAGSEHRRDYGGVEQRWLVVFSEQAYEREMATFQRRLARHREAAARELRALGRQRFACLIYALAERKVRRALHESGESIPDPKGKPTQQPTLRRIFQVFEGIDVLLITEGDELRERCLVNLRAIHRKILDLLGAEVKKCYLLN